MLQQSSLYVYCHLIAAVYLSYPECMYTSPKRATISLINGYCNYLSLYLHILVLIAIISWYMLHGIFTLPWMYIHYYCSHYLTTAWCIYPLPVHILGLINYTLYVAKCSHIHFLKINKMDKLFFILSVDYIT